ncbi:16S rRNA (cytosine(967)-C(5))-methyltransferase RsmB [Agarilytica rhodophyticola]|uniref:16S rRNA (cytosine(967)-C(5))-methyltransferase RsmB n=1 Tax=Agarilytica rhodophyticola TaxID=1737490 RepID=UPI000B34460F|nr:16S rRNA (cytosine(967)-C(5))-methyltransferase RsmB [Agarilytica rhodophyticola]
MNVRAVAAHALVPVITQKSSLDSAIQNCEPSLKSKDLPLLKELCFGVVRHFFSLESVLAQLLSKSLKAKDKDIHALALIGLYQIWYMRTPDHAAINETVNAAKKLKKSWAAGLLNGLLRNFIRQQDELTTGNDNTSTDATALFNHPQWLIERLKNAWPNNWQEIIAANNVQAPLTLRTNLRRNSRQQFVDQLKENDYEFSLCQFSPVGLTLSKPVDVTQLPGFENGSCSVQDEAAQLAATLLDLAPGQRVLDACCAPGGKTCHIAEQEAELKEVVALDLEASRMQRVKENLARLELDATLITCDAQDISRWWDGALFDRILLDAPCSATGVIRRHPDIKLLRRNSDIAQLANLQARLLKQLWQTLAPGGLLVYATCSVLPEENENLIKAFVEQQADAIHLPLTEVYNDISWGIERPMGRQLFPQVGGHDGFYYALIKKERS